MYARNLSEILHRHLVDNRDYAATLQRFESLRGYGMLPRGRANAGKRLEDTEIANAVLGFEPSLPGWAGHVSLIMGGLRPVGGLSASFRYAPNLKAALAELVGAKEANEQLINLTLSTIRKRTDAEYFAQICFVEGGNRRVASYVSKSALSLFGNGAEETFDADREVTPSARQLVLGQSFFIQLQKSVEISRTLDQPVKTDWREYESEDERQAFYKRLGARTSSRFLNLGVDTQATWPREPTRVQFSGHHLVLFPKTTDTSHSISIDLTHERLTSDQARTLCNRFLSLLSWCDDQHAILRDGWSGNPVPVPVPKRDLAFATTHHWAFRRSIPNDEALLMCLAYFREGLNASEAGMTTFEVLSFFKVFEVKHSTKNQVKEWVQQVFDVASTAIAKNDLIRFHEDRGEVNVPDYVYRNCRVATAHAAKDVPSDADASSEIRRLSNAAPILHALARYFIRTEFQFSELYFSDNRPSQ